MSDGDDRWALGPYWIPFALGLATACASIWSLVALGRSMGMGLVVALGLGTIIGLIAVVQAIFAASDARALTESRSQQQALETHLTEARVQAQQLRAHLEVLTAMREVTRILSDTVDLKPIATRVFDVLQPLLAADEIALLLKNDEGSLVLKALRREDKTLYGEQLSGGEVDQTDAVQALEHETLVKATSGSAGTFCVPLVADQSAVGVMRFVIPLTGTHEEKEAQIDALEETLTDIAKHLALVVKTPSLHDRAIIDSLTGLFTRRHFDIRIDDMFRLARRYATPFALILLDIDHFKPVNDTYGHRAGDEALRQVAATVTGAIRDCDSAFRYGGEEFAVLLPETTAAQALHIGERLRSAVSSCRVRTDAGELSLTISLGVADYNPELANHGEIIALADRALYAAKQAGRNRAELAKAAPEKPGETG